MGLCTVAAPGYGAGDGIFPMYLEMNRFSPLLCKFQRLSVKELHGSGV